MLKYEGQYLDTLSDRWDQFKESAVNVRGTPLESAETLGSHQI
ncbi:MAG TPA: hypothetical protein VFG90_12230 [Nitrososphaeraceae archaeon]|nr:hypothetical protein [Nitrososphaeraceae archaeon]